MQRLMTRVLVGVVFVLTAVACGGAPAVVSTETTTVGSVPAKTSTTTAAPAPATAASQAATGSSLAGTTPGTYKEAPQLADLVKQGKLPPVAQRLPAEPRIVKPVNEVGKYGGEQRGGHFGPQIGGLDTEALRAQSLLFIEPDLQTLSPNILKTYDHSADFKSWTITLRQGMKWSDGEPFTSDDFIFWYEDIFLNKELTPTPLVVYSPGGQPMKMTKVDPATLKVEFATANPNFDLTMARSNANDRMFAPKHYLSKWHIKYNDKANDVAKSENQASWTTAFQLHRDYTQAETDTKQPNVNPWVLSRIDELGNKFFERNPYYWAVDTAGNQLPYIDRQVGVLVKDAQTRTLKLISGELSNAGENPLPVKDFTLYAENEAKGDYKVYLFENTRGNDVGISFNQTHKDPVVKKIFQDVRFRQALSLAINRKQINDVLYFGKATIRNATIPPQTSFYEEWMGKYFADFDATKAKALLDEIGLKLDGATNVRLREDGKPLELSIECYEEFCPQSEQVAEMWTAIGVKTAMRQIERSLFIQRNQANEQEVFAHPFDAIAEPNIRAANCGRIRPLSAGDTYAALWKTWYNSKGAQGEQPSKENQDLMALCDRFSTAVPGSPEYKQTGKELATLFTNQLYTVGTTVAPRVIIISNRLGNAPTKGTFSNDYSFWVPFRGDQWYIK
ncbi:MAG: ABC transporter substrate-binding protein [Herpetosiphon sp.]